MLNTHGKPFVVPLCLGFHSLEKGRPDEPQPANPSVRSSLIGPVAIAGVREPETHNVPQGHR